MSWLRRLLRPFTKHKGTEVHHRFRPRLQFAPDAMIGSSTVSKGVKANLRRNIELLGGLEKGQVQKIYEAALRSVALGRDLSMLHVELMEVAGMNAGRAAEVALTLNARATAQINREHQASLGIVHAKWIHANAPCMRDSIFPTAEDLKQDSAHRSASGKRYAVSKGLFVDGKWTWPGVEEGCKCTSRSILPWLRE